MRVFPDGGTKKLRAEAQLSTDFPRAFGMVAEARKVADEWKRYGAGVGIEGANLGSSTRIRFTSMGLPLMNRSMIANISLEGASNRS